MLPYKISLYLFQQNADRTSCFSFLACRLIMAKFLINIAKFLINMAKFLIIMSKFLIIVLSKLQ